MQTPGPWSLQVIELTDVRNYATEHLQSLDYEHYSWVLRVLDQIMVDAWDPPVELGQVYDVLPM
jgi:hypothetical protein